KDKTKNIYEKLFEDNIALAVCKEETEKAFLILKQCYEKGGKLLICGNGGSAADSEHIVGELMKGFLLKRELPQKIKDKFQKEFPSEFNTFTDNLQGALPAISLNSQIALSSAFINDVKHDMVYAQQVYGYGKKDDVLLALSTSGNSLNVVNAVKTALVCELKVIGMTGITGGILNNLCDVVIKAPSDMTYKIQEYHLPIYHALCAMLEEEIFG
ncbi:MAG: hypothetical protein K0S55_154, partial [Clostridia bacterium]|nr:hypothetical protein [Clostridia bacterium]